MEKELRKIFEDTTTNNVKAILEYSTETRKIVRGLEEELIKLNKTITNQNVTIGELRNQLSNVQAELFRGGT